MSTRRRRTAPAAGPLVAALLPAALLHAPVVVAQDEEPARSFEQAAAAAERDLQDALAELSGLRDEIASEKLPLVRRLRELEDRLSEKRSTLEDLTRRADAENLDVAGLRTELEARREEKAYLSNLLDEYARNLESRLHVAELARYRDRIDEARLAPDSSDADAASVLGTQAGLIETSLERLHEHVGGARFEGRGVAENGRVEDVTYVLLGPVALYEEKGSGTAGIAEQQIGSMEPALVPVPTELAAGVNELVATGSGRVPLDPTLGKARKVAATQDTVREHVLKGGPVMIPILALAAAALLTALLKWIQLARVRKPSEKKVKSLLEAVARGDRAVAAERAKDLPGPSGQMLRDGVEHLGEPKELVEEVMYEKALETRLRLKGFLPFIAVAAAAAPLLGLLGTVTGIINTFKLITVFGTGDAKTLSAGISEALITTEFGLIVAIPTLFLHALLSRKAQRHVDGMEKTAVAFLNRVNGGGGDERPPARAAGAEDAPDAGKPRPRPGDLAVEGV